MPTDIEKRLKIADQALAHVAKALPYGAPNRYPIDEIQQAFHAQMQLYFCNEHTSQLVVNGRLNKTAVLLLPVPQKINILNNFITRFSTQVTANPILHSEAAKLRIPILVAAYLMNTLTSYEKIRSLPDISQHVARYQLFGVGNCEAHAMVTFAHILKTYAEDPKFKNLITPIGLRILKKIRANGLLDEENNHLLVYIGLGENMIYIDPYLGRAFKAQDLNQNLLPGFEKGANLDIQSSGFLATYHWKGGDRCPISSVEPSIAPGVVSGWITSISDALTLPRKPALPIVPALNLNTDNSSDSSGTGSNAHSNTNVITNTFVK